MNTFIILTALLACKDGEPPGESEPAEVTDADGDGAAAGVDCDDADARRHPAAVETCDGVDEDCDGQVDEGLTRTFYADADGDGHGDPGAPREACALPAGHVEVAGDCDDAAAGVHPGAEEVCDDLDNDCDGAVDGVAWVSDDFNEGGHGLQLNGAARVVDGRLVLTEAEPNQRGSAFYPGEVDADEFTVRFTLEIGGGTGADGMTFAMLMGEPATAIGLDGVGLGVQGLHGYAVEFDTYDNDVRDRDDNHVAVVRADDLDNLAVGEAPPLMDGGPLAAELHFDMGTLTLRVEGQERVSATLPEARPPYRVGFTAGTGRSTNRHTVDDVVIGCF